MKFQVMFAPPGSISLLRLRSPGPGTVRLLGGSPAAQPIGSGAASHLAVGRLGVSGRRCRAVAPALQQHDIQEAVVLLPALS